MLSFFWITQNSFGILKYFFIMKRKFLSDGQTDNPYIHFLWEYMRCESGIMVQC